ncbi:MAG: type II-A CRISPR-associated protein Csn2 [Erysipelotrichaceae bacterium]
MMIKIFSIGKDLFINEGEIGILNIKPQELYLKICLTLLNRISFNEQNDLIILDHEQRLKDKDLLFVSDILSFELDNKAILTKVSKELINYINSDMDIKSEYINENRKVLNLLSLYLDSFDLDYIIEEELELSGLLKLSGVNFLTEDETCIDMIDRIIHIHKRLFGTNYFIFKGISSLITFDQIEIIEDIAKKYQTSIILLENSDLTGVVTSNIVTIECDYSVF